MATYSLLTLSETRDSYLLKSPDSSNACLDHDSPALALMTDFHGIAPLSMPATTKIDEALHYMMISGVRLLFVVDSKSKLLGSITSYDIQGEKPMLYLQSQDCRIGICSRADIEVQDIMTPVSDWKTLRYDNLAGSSLGDVAHTFQTLGQRHLIVVETQPGQVMAQVRGIFSLSDLERALEALILTDETANSFSEIEQALNK